MKRAIKGFLSLLSFLTTIPTNQNNIKEASEYFYLSPLIGLIEGIIIGLIFFLLRFNFIINGSILLASHLLLTGGLNLDGFSDYSDVIGSRKIGEEAEKILKDPRKGSFAIIFTSLIIIIRFASFSNIKNIFSIVLSYVTGIESGYLISYFSNAPKYQGLGSMFIESSKNKKKLLYNLIIYLIIIIILLFVSKTKYYLISIFSLLLVPIIVFDSNKRLGYANGDVIGFTIEIIETASLLISVII
ncbi:cobalamin-5-phosphate synthase [Caldisphaera lagunensis DSM 15908]|uniref:Adenosylcobinamide-GDP ribazoletransferase n=1 Tax=Caldisphaera lagunensis (strain DSM 15908 / JCM 11604 / ANMR 0165 / IC-154) TaxID=1056495 RepID=L0ACR2_CALLD|nr:adenosylcobinamide-GDP ribazoletransferase [Caldisphaera lagunensis]AFZ70845.1 cobalamin-5-phosphate synthase [Caldisphaera lagunensis DSM 15908]